MNPIVAMSMEYANLLQQQQPHQQSLHQQPEHIPQHQPPSPSPSPPSGLNKVDKNINTTGYAAVQLAKTAGLENDTTAEKNIGLESKDIDGGGQPSPQSQPHLGIKGSAMPAAVAAATTAALSGGTFPGDKPLMVGELSVNQGPCPSDATLQAPELCADVDDLSAHGSSGAALAGPAPEAQPRELRQKPPLPLPLCHQQISLPHASQEQERDQLEAEINEGDEDDEVETEVESEAAPPNSHAPQFGQALRSPASDKGHNKSGMADANHPPLDVEDDGRKRYHSDSESDELEEEDDTIHMFEGNLVENKGRWDDRPPALMAPVNNYSSDDDFEADDSDDEDGNDSNGPHGFADDFEDSVSDMEDGKDDHLQAYRGSMNRTQLDSHRQLQRPVPRKFLSESVSSDTSSSSQTELGRHCEHITTLLQNGALGKALGLMADFVDQAINLRSASAVDLDSDRRLSKDEIEYLENRHLGQWTKFLLERRTVPRSQLFIPFLHKLLRLGCLIVQQDGTIPEVIATSTQLILDRGSDLGMYRRTTKRVARLANMGQSAGFNDISSDYGPEDGEAPQLQREFQDLFHSLDGIPTCLLAIEAQLVLAESHEIKVSNMHSILVMMSKAQVQAGVHQSRATLVTEYSRRLTAAVLQYFPDQFDAFKAVDKTMVTSIIANVGAFLTDNIVAHQYQFNSVFDSEVEEEVHDPTNLFNPGEIKFADFRLELAVKMLKTSRLDLRLAGLVELKEVLIKTQRVQVARSRLRRRSDSDMDLQMEYDRKPIENLCTRLHEMNIVGYIFGPNIHLEIVQRSADILATMLQASALTLQDLNDIWSAAGGNQHRSIVYGVYQVVSDLAIRLPQDYLNHLFHQLQAAPLTQWDQQLVDLARSLFAAWDQRAKYNPEEGKITMVPYMTLLNVLRLSTPSYCSKEDTATYGSPPLISRDVVHKIASLLTEGLGAGPSPQDRRKLIEFCLSDLRANHPGAIWCLTMIQSILDHHAPNDLAATLHFFRQTCQALPELFMSDLRVFTTAVKNQIPTPSPTIASFTSMSTQLQQQEQAKAMQLKARLDFLGVMFKKYPSEWSSTELADTIWDCLISDPIGLQEQDNAFNCIKLMIDYSFLVHLYENRLPELGLQQFSESAWECTQEYFLRINWNRHKLHVSSGAGEMLVHIMSAPDGLDLLWNIALHAQHPVVGSKANSFLVKLMNQNPHNQEIVPFVISFREGLMNTCLNYLFGSATELCNPDEQSRAPHAALTFERSISIMRAFLALCNAEVDDREDIHITLDEDRMLNIRVNFQASTTAITIHPSDKLRTLRRKIAAHLRIPDNLRLVSLGKDFIQQWNTRTLEDLQVENNQVFMVAKRQMSTMNNNIDLNGDINNAQEEPMERRSLPSDLVSLNENFERLLQILLLEERYATQAWEIVERLPTSPHLLLSLQTLESPVQWTQLLDSRSPFLLLYSLQIVNSLLIKDQLVPGFPWTMLFLKHAGMEYLTELVMSDQGLGSHSNSATARKALNLLLKVLAKLMGCINAQNVTNGVAIQGPSTPQFLNRLISEILISASPERVHGPDDLNIVMNATSLISSICSGPMGWHHFHSRPDVRSLLFLSMVQSDSAHIRRTVAQMGARFCSEGEENAPDVAPVPFFLSILESFLPLSADYVDNCSELFEFFDHLVKMAPQSCSEEQYREVYDKLVSSLHSYGRYEESGKDDTILIGLIRVAWRMVSIMPSLRSQTDVGLVNYLLNECLFPKVATTISTDSNEVIQPIPARFQSEGSRGAAFEFLEALAKGQGLTLKCIMDSIARQFDRPEPLDNTWGYSPYATRRARCGFVGLQNLGATCYVNSITQQFFMNTTFRKGILEAPNGTDGTAEKYDTLIYQLQVLFGNLQESQRRSYNAGGFCHAYKDWDGNPMNVAVQMDVDEFFNMLFDRLSNTLKGTPQEELLKDHYGGKLIQQIRSKDCEHISEREDSFFSIQCEVKNKKTIEESLQLYVQGEILDGDNKYKCSTCDKHVDAIKRACVKELPKGLILHLKRFDYDMDTMRRIKINDHFEFPDRLDMEPYTLDYLSRKEQAKDGTGATPQTPLLGLPKDAEQNQFQYDLVGVLVHTGTADSGHYYSYIKDRSRGDCGHDAGRPSWYHFNDSTVEEFDPSDIAAKAFGGSEFVQSESPYQRSPGRTVVKPYSAYMLFYERGQIPVNSRASPSQDTAIVSPVSAVSPILNTDSTVTKIAKPPHEVCRAIALENSMLMSDLAVFDTACYRFLVNVFQLYPSVSGQLSSELNLEALTTQYSIDFFFKVLIHARDVDMELKEWVQLLCELLSRNFSGCLNLLRNILAAPTALSDMLLSCPITQVREAVVEVISWAIEVIVNACDVSEGVLLDGDVVDSAFDTCGVHSVVVELVKKMVSLLPEAHIMWRNFDQYFLLFHKISQAGAGVSAMMVRAGAVEQLVDFYIEDDRNDSVRKKMGDKFTKPLFKYLVSTLQELILACDIPQSCKESFLNRRRSSNASSSSAVGSPRSPASSSSPSSDNQESSDLSLSKNDITVLSTPDFQSLLYNQPVSSHEPREKVVLWLFKMIRDLEDTSEISRIVMHLSSEPQLHVTLMNTVMAMIDIVNEEQFTLILSLLKDSLQLTDGMTEWRVSHFLDRLEKVVVTLNSSSPAFECLEFLRGVADFGQCGRLIQGWLLERKEWLLHTLALHADQDVRQKARSFFLELLSSEAAFNGWDDFEAQRASTKHFQDVASFLHQIEKMVPYILNIPRGEREEAGWRMIEYIQTLSELVKSDVERAIFSEYWILFTNIIAALEKQHVVLDQDKKEMMLFWHRMMSNDNDIALRLSKMRSVRELLQNFFVSLQINPESVRYHRDALPAYYGILLQMCRVSPEFHQAWADGHNYSWALGTMVWGAYEDHCPTELRELLHFSLSEIPNFRPTCWRQPPKIDVNPQQQPLYGQQMRFFTVFCRSMFEHDNEMSADLFFKSGALNQLTTALVASTSGSTSAPEFFAMDALSVMNDYLCKMDAIENTPSFAHGIDHWETMPIAIERLLANLMWNVPVTVFDSSLAILATLIRNGPPSRTLPILNTLCTAHLEWDNDQQSKPSDFSNVQSIFGGSLSLFATFGALGQLTSNVGTKAPFMHMGPVVFMFPPLWNALNQSSKQKILHDFYVPYWEFCSLVCQPDTWPNAQSKVIQLAAVLAKDQCRVGVTIHLKILCEAADESKAASANGSDWGMALLSPAVVAFVEELLMNVDDGPSDSHPLLMASTSTACLPLLTTVAPNLDPNSLENAKAKLLRLLDQELKSLEDEENDQEESEASGSGSTGDRDIDGVIDVQQKWKLMSSLLTIFAIVVANHSSGSNSTSVSTASTALSTAEQQAKELQVLLRDMDASVLALGKAIDANGVAANQKKMDEVLETLEFCKDRLELLLSTHSRYQSASPSVSSSLLTLSMDNNHAATFTTTGTIMSPVASTPLQQLMLPPSVAGSPMSILESIVALPSAPPMPADLLDIAAPSVPMIPPMMVPEDVPMENAEIPDDEAETKNSEAALSKGTNASANASPLAKRSSKAATLLVATTAVAAANGVESNLATVDLVAVGSQADVAADDKENDPPKLLFEEDEAMEAVENDDDEVVKRAD